MPVYFESQDETTLEPYVVIGGYHKVGKGNKVGRILEQTDQQIDIFMPDNGRLQAEEIRSQAIGLLGYRNVISDLRKDNSIGRNVYHIIIKILEDI